MFLGMVSNIYRFRVMIRFWGEVYMSNVFPVGSLGFFSTTTTVMIHLQAYISSPFLRRISQPPGAHSRSWRTPRSPGDAVLVRQSPQNSPRTLPYNNSSTGDDVCAFVFVCVWEHVKTILRLFGGEGWQKSLVSTANTAASTTVYWGWVVEFYSWIQYPRTNREWGPTKKPTDRYRKNVWQQDW